jgi:hypothetical protein
MTFVELLSENMTRVRYKICDHSHAAAKKGLMDHYYSDYHQRMAARSAEEPRNDDETMNNSLKSKSRN